MSCTDCGQDTLGPGTCSDCCRNRIDNYPTLKSVLDKISIYVRLLQDGDPDNENPKKILDSIEKDLQPYEELKKDFGE